MSDRIPQSVTLLNQAIDTVDSLTARLSGVGERLDATRGRVGLPFLAPTVAPGGRPGNAKLVEDTALERLSQASERLRATVDHIEQVADAFGPLA